MGDEHPDGTRSVLFDLNGHRREVRVRDLGASVDAAVRMKADRDDWTQVGASVPGKVVQILAQPGDTVAKGGQLLVSEAMKMETAVQAPRDAVVESILVRQGDEVDAGDLLVRLGPIPEREEV